MKRRVRYLFDIETDNLLDDLTTVHCGVVYDLDTTEIWEFTPETIHLLPTKLSEADELWGHNVIDFDLQAIKKVFPKEYEFSLSHFEGTEGERLFDSMVLSRTIWSDITSQDYENIAKGVLILPDEKGAKKKLQGSHSLRAWGYRLGYFKGNAEGEVSFEKYTEEMLEYCKRDVLLNARLIEKIFQRIPELAEGTVPEFVWNEHQFFRYLNYQQRNGVGFDVEFAEYLCGFWTKELDKHLKVMRQLIPDMVVEATFTPKVNRPDLGYVKGEPFTKTTIITFNPRSPDHVVKFLRKKYDWKPIVFTKPSKKHPQGQPEVSYEVLSHLPYKEAPLLARIRLLHDRLKLVKKSKGGSAWLQCVKNGRIYGRINHNGTPTARCRHFAPNLGNIPSTKSIWGKTIRKLFIPSEEFVFVGCDFDGLEMRCLAEVLWPYDGGAFFRMAFSGSKEEGTDPHSKNSDSIAHSLWQAGYHKVSQNLNREIAKTAFYAAIFGAWPKKLGEIVCDGTGTPAYLYPKIGKCVQEGLFENIVGLKEVLEELTKEYNECIARGEWPYILGLDGRKVPIRKKSALLNSKLQSMGAILSKKACVFLLQRAPKVGLGLPGKLWRPALHVHDEIENEVKNERAVISKYVELVTECFADAGRHFKLTVPIVGSAAVGPNWGATH